MQIIVDKDDDEELTTAVSMATVLGNIAEKGHFMAKMWERTKRLLLLHFKDGQTIREIFVPSHSVL